MRVSIAVSVLLLIACTTAFGGQATSPYPLTTCIVSEHPLAAQGDPVVVEHETRELRFCSADCAEKFGTEKSDYLRKLDAAIIADQLPLYPLDTCLNSGGPLDGMGKPYDLVHGNRLVRLCCGGCVGSFEKNSAEFMAELDEAVAARQAVDYPLTTCVNSGAELGSMGEPHDLVLAGRLVRLCCAGCEDGARNNLAAVLEKLAAARVSE